jgi:SAM-dependent methyltransferase
MERSRDVREFYNRFAGEVLIEDFRRLNLRQDAVRRLCREFIPAGARVLEIGCGAGINVRHLSRFAGRVVGVDISERNIEIAKEYAGSANTEFRVLDVIHGAGELAALGPFDAVVLPDVIEHVPLERHHQLFAAVESVLARPGSVLITYPSPEYQSYLKSHEPKTLQLVDETIELDDLLRHTSLKIVHFSYKHVWSRNQYVHLVLGTDRSFTAEPVERSAISRIVYRVRKRLWRARNFPFLRRVGKRLGAAGDPSR